MKIFHLKLFINECKFLTNKARHNESKITNESLHKKILLMKLATMLRVVDDCKTITSTCKIVNEEQQHEEAQFEF
jgi:hypothetical protein